MRSVYTLSNSTINCQFSVGVSNKLTQYTGPTLLQYVSEITFLDLETYMHYAVNAYTFGSKSGTNLKIWDAQFKS